MSYCLRATAMQGNVRLFFADTTEMIEKAREIHGTSATASAALGRFLSVTSLMGIMLKSEKDKMTISMNGGGPAGNLVAVTNMQGNVKGYVSNPQADLPVREDGKLDVGGLVGKEGRLNVIKDLGLKEPYVGQVPVVSGEIGDDFTYYFAVSEQVPSAVVVGVLVEKDLSIKSSGALIVQMMPGSNEMLADVIEFRLKEVPPLSALIAEGKSGEEILNMLFDDMDLKINDRIEVDYVCDCHRDRFEKALISLGREELVKLSEEGEAEIKCQFCNKVYTFSSEELLGLSKS